MNGAVRAVVRMGIYVGAKVYFIHEVRRDSMGLVFVLPEGPSAHSLVVIVMLIAAFSLAAHVSM